MRWYFYCNTHALSQFTYISDHKTLEMTVYQYIILYFVRVNVIRVLIYYTFFIFMNYDFWKLSYKYYNVIIDINNIYFILRLFFFFF